MIASMLGVFVGVSGLVALVGASAEQITRVAAGEPSRAARRSERAGPSGQGDRASDATW